MIPITRFEDIEAWRKARQLARLVYEVSSDSCFSKDFGLRDQIRRSAISVLSNIAEGFERDGDREFKHFLSIAKGSVGELRAQLYVALDVQLITRPKFDELYSLATETAQLTAGFIRYLSNSDLRGKKFRHPESARP